MKQPGLTIEPPPPEADLYRVVYTIDIGANTPLEAAQTVYQIMTDRDSLPPVLDVLNSKGTRIRIDLSQRQ